MLEQLGETVTRYPRGVVADAADVTAIVDLGVEGEQPVDDAHGSQRVRWLELTLPASIDVAIAERSQQRDQFSVRGLLWHAESVPRENAGLQTVRCKRTEAASTKRTRA
ncbi:MAG TPA: hypothetical protein VFX03_05970 [Thermomicrobiales bacterium]|nr:hypothetical protein [Thermomicrobiales bacterium]